MSYPSIWQPFASASSVANLTELAGLTIPSPQPNGALVYVASENEFYRFSSTSGAAVSSPNVIATQAGGQSRWLRSAIVTPSSPFQALVHFQLDITIAGGGGQPTNSSVISNATCVGANILSTNIGGGVSNGNFYVLPTIQLDLSIPDADRRPFLGIVDDSGWQMAASPLLASSGLNTDSYNIYIPIFNGVPDGTYTTWVTLGLL